MTANRYIVSQLLEHMRTCERARHDRTATTQVTHYNPALAVGRKTTWQMDSTKYN